VPADSNVFEPDRCVYVYVNDLVAPARSLRWIDHDSTTGFSGNGHLESRSGFRKPTDSGNWEGQAPVYEVNGKPVQRFPSGLT